MKTRSGNPIKTELPNEVRNPKKRSNQTLKTKQVRKLKSGTSQPITYQEYVRAKLD